MQVRLSEMGAIGQDRSFVRELIAGDVLGLRKGGEWGYERLRLLQMMSSYYATRTYLQDYPELMPQLSQMIVNSHFHPLNPSKLPTLYSILDILQKCMIRQTLFRHLPLTPAFLSWILTLLQTHQHTYCTDNSITRVYTSAAALVINLTMHRMGRQAMAQT